MSDGTMVINNMNLVFEGIKGINIIKEESQRYPPVENPLHKLFECPFLIGSPFYYNWFLNIVNPVYYQFKDIPLKMALLQWMDNDLVHRTYKITFKELFTMIITIVENHKKKEEMKKRLIIVLKDSVEFKFSFTETIHRMINALVGFVDGIYKVLSARDVIEMNMDIFIKQLKDKKINRETVKEKMIEMFSHVGEKDNISDDYKEANLMALDDYENEFEGFDRL